MVVEDPAGHDLHDRCHLFEGMADHVDEERVGVAGPGKGRHLRSETAVDGHRQIMVFGRRPNPVHLGREEFDAVVALRAERHTRQSVLGHERDLIHRGIDRLQGTDAHAVQALRVFGDEVGHPAVVGPGVGRGHVRPFDVAGQQVERRKHEGGIYALVVHDLEPFGGVVAAGNDVVPRDVGAVGTGNAGLGHRSGRGLPLDVHRVFSLAAGFGPEDQIPELGVAVFGPNRRRLADVGVGVVDRGVLVCLGRSHPSSLAPSGARCRTSAPRSPCPRDRFVSKVPR